MLILMDYEYRRPSALLEALGLLQEKSVIIAGGSDVMPQLKTAVIEPGLLIDLAGIKELQDVEEQEDGIHIGSMATLASLAKNPLILSDVPAIAEAARNVASPQIRNRGTLGGNILQARRCFYYNQTKEWRQGIPACYKVGGERCIQIPNSSVCRAIYYSDMAPALLAYDADVVVVTENGEETRSCRSVIEEHIEDRDVRCILKEFIIPRNRYAGAYAKFMKYSLRGGIDFPIINFACFCKDESIRLYMGAMSVNVIELTQTESYLSETKDLFDIKEAYRIALAEAKEKSKIIREAGISVQVKRGSICYIQELLTDLKKHMST